MISMGTYILGIDQSTQGTKALILNNRGCLLARADQPHCQIVDKRGWVEHDPEEIYRNMLLVVKEAVEKAGIEKSEIAGIGISNQRETALVWDRNGNSVYPAIVWQCARGQEICDRLKGSETMDADAFIRERTGLPISPYFSAAKIAWILENVEGVRERAKEGSLCCGTMDTFLVYRLTKGKSYGTDYSNASRTQLFNIRTLSWDEEICRMFGIPKGMLAKVLDSDAFYGMTDLDGYLDQPIPIHSVFGDSHGALFGQGCLEAGMGKATYGTGSSVMMNVGEKPVFSRHGLASSLAFAVGGKVYYALEGNVNYTGAVITWLQKDLKLIKSPKETEEWAKKASQEDKTYFVPAFSGLGAPYWNSKATGLFTGITRITGKAEMIRAALDCIAYQIADVLNAMAEDAGIQMKELRVDGGPTRNLYLMQFQSDIAGIPVCIPELEELSGIGAAYAAGVQLKVYDWNELFAGRNNAVYMPEMPKEKRKEKYRGWKAAVEKVL